ncbi:bifunctional 3-oxoadipate enol-lactonase/4-carboxymuconolactone decarboxylase PcaDC [Buttiauxella agrestis]
MSLYYQLEGRSGAPVVVLSNSLGTTLEMWQPQMAALLENFRVLRYDTHGHGRTTKNGKTTLPQLAEDVISVMDDAGVKQAHFCGISMGGLTGLWLARFAPERILSVTVANSAAKVGEQNGWLERARTVRHDGMEAIANSAPQRWFTEDFVKHHHSQVDALCATLAGIDTEGYASCCEALAAADLRVKLATSHYRCSLSPEPVTRFAASPTANLCISKSTARISSRLNPRIFPVSATLMVSMWRCLTLFNRTTDIMKDEEHYQQGMEVRRAVLGDSHVDRTLSQLTPLNDEFQNFITRYAWGDIWTRPGLERHTRSMITIAMLIALNREAELKMHLRAAFNNGVTRDELKELIMHSALYCGLPAANATMHLAQQVFDELDAAG